MKERLKCALMALVAISFILLSNPYIAASSTLWPANAVPAVIDSGPDDAVELGVRFRADVGGTITGIRFYKAATNTGTHVANLWTNGGSRLATATFTSETASGWQQVTFASPVNITANTDYVASYHTNAGHYSFDANYFTGKGVDNAPLHAPANGVSGVNGVFAYGGASNFPNQGWIGSNYWVDPVFAPSVGSDPTPPTVTDFTVPATSSSLTVSITSFSATDNVAVTGFLVNESATAPAPSAAGWSATAPSSYTFGAAGSKTLFAWAKDAAGNVSASRSATVTVNAASLSGNPILIITSTSNPFSTYLAEILRAEGITSFTARDLSQVTATVLASFDVVLLGEMTLTATQVNMLSSWVTSGGRLVAMRPDKKLAPLLGLVDRSATQTGGYLLIDTSQAPGTGIVEDTIQYHGNADLYALDSASSLATLYSSATRATSNPALTLTSVGTRGGQAAAFTYDLARSIVYTRQGNPSWSNQERDGRPPIRSDDLYFGDARFDPQADWVDLDKVAIPQADEQQRLLANLLIQMTMDRRTVPRFWYFPRSLPAVVVMTGDDHGNGGTVGRFNAYQAMSPRNCSVANWECIRGTSYIYPSTPITNAQASAFNTAGFEVALHVLTNCADYTPALLRSQYSSQLSTWRNKYSSLPSPVTNRTHCIAWSDYTTQASVELTNGIRLDTNFYYWPPDWVADRPGFFTGSGMPMRFADANGNLIDVYEAATQMTDESGQSFPYTIDSLLDRALGSEGYYGAFVVNAHTDVVASAVSDAVVESAVARGIPVITSRQLLTWVDGRNASTFNSLSRSGNVLTFSLTAAAGATGLVAMVPVSDRQDVASITNNGNSVPFTMIRKKGVQYASFPAVSGAYRVTYASNVDSPTVTSVEPVSGATGVATSSAVSATFSSAMDPSSINSGTFELHSVTNTLVSAAVSYNGTTRTTTLKPNQPLGNGTSYVATVKGGSAGVRDVAGNPLAGDFTWSFSTGSASGGPSSLWPATTVPAVVDSGPDLPVELGVRFRSDSSGFVTGIRFYKAVTNTGTHVANLWSGTGSLLASATFSSESASGWQQVTFPAPVPITANTVYVASYHTNTGHYSIDQQFFSGNSVDNPPLHADSSLNGVFAYGSQSAFPHQGWNSTNYWVDVVFTTTAPQTPQTLSFGAQSLGTQALEPQASTLAAIKVTPADQRIAVGTSQRFTATGTYADGSTKNITDQVTWRSSDPSLVSIGPTGVATAHDVGSVTISATHGGITGNTRTTATDGVASARNP